MAVVVTVPNRMPALRSLMREVHLVAADEQAHVRQADLEEDIGADQGAVEEVPVVGQEPDLFHFGTLMRDFAVEPEEKGQPVRVAGGHHEGHHCVQGRVPRLAQQRGQAFGVCRLGVVVHHPDPVSPAGHGLEDGQREAARAAKVRLGPDVVHVGVPRRQRPCEGSVPLSTRQMVPHRSGLVVDGVQQDGQLPGTVKRHGSNCNRRGSSRGSFQHGRQWYSRRRWAV